MGALHVVACRLQSISSSINKEQTMKNCEDVMTSDIRVISSGASALDASHLMRDDSVGFLPVCDPQSGKLIGVVTDRDLVLRMCATDARPSAIRIVDLISTPPAVCQEWQPIKVAEKLMDDLDISRIVVVDKDDHPVGVISLTDLIMDERNGRALRTARGVKERDASGPHQSVENITLTPSDPNDPVQETHYPDAREIYEGSGTAQSRDDSISGGRQRRAYKEFPG